MGAESLPGWGATPNLSTYQPSSTADLTSYALPAQSNTVVPASAYADNASRIVVNNEAPTYARAGGDNAQQDHMLADQWTQQDEALYQQEQGFSSSPSGTSSGAGKKDLTPDALATEGGSAPTGGAGAGGTGIQTGTTNQSMEVFNDYRVKLVSAHNYSFRVIFLATPDVTESRDVNYKAVEPIHLPGQIWAYTNTGARSFSLGARFFARTAAEASQVLRDLQLIKSWAMPWFGASTSGSGEYLGAPPAVLLFSAYSKGKGGMQINRVPVVLKGYSIPLTAEVDYIPSEEGVPVPSFMQVDLTLLEAHSPKGYEGFSLQQYRAGTLEYY